MPLHRTRSAPRPLVTTLLAAAISTALVGSLAACSGGSASTSAPAAATPTQDPAVTALLEKAQTTLDGASSARFTLASSNVPEGGTRLIDGKGQMTRPTPSTGAFSGDVSVLLNGSKLTVSVISVKNTVYVKLPFAATYQIADPAGFGITDPAELISSTTGISQLFPQLADVQDKGETRLGADVVRRIDGTVPGLLVQKLLTSADPSQRVKVELSIVPASGELRQAKLTGPFFVKGTDSSYTVRFDQYNKKVTITAPAGA